MPVNITISHDTPEGVIQHVKALAASFERQQQPPAPPVTETVKQAVAAIAETKAAEALKRRGRPPAAEKPPQISTQPENRVDPEADSQDALDEAAESGLGFDLGEATKPIVRDDVRALALAYQTKYGPAAVQEDGKKIFGYPKLSDIPDDKLAEAHASMWNAIENNPYKRAVVGL